MTPPDIQVRPAVPDDCGALANIIIDATYSAFKGRVPDACFGGLTREESATNWNRFLKENDGSETLLVAEFEARHVVALILAGKPSSHVVQDENLAARFPVEITSLQVDPAWQQKGLGRLLIHKACEWLEPRGARALMVRVLEDNPNVAFYHALGAVQVGSQDYDWEGYQTSELILGWETGLPNSN